LLARTTARVHLTGHSYGGKVVLSALSLVQHPRKVTSLLLLQPAVNTFCFAEKIPEHGGQPGAFRVALDRTERPVFTTFSAHDSPLTRFFHVALRRDTDLGEVRPAGAPSKFAALGGFGPSGLRAGESTTLPMLGPPNKYKIPAGVRLCALDGSNNKIMSHGDVRNEFTEWALVNLVSGSDLP
jgi:pimeloyl-ACP methyl ester carboxylesterase